MYDFMNRFRQFMVGRYGHDKLNHFLLKAAVALMIVRVLLFPLFFHWRWIREVLSWLIWVCVILTVLRAISKNRFARERENELYRKLEFHVTEGWRKGSDSCKEFRTYKVFRCPGCGQKVRIPRGHGKIEIHCPKCGRDFIKRS